MPKNKKDKDSKTVFDVSRPGKAAPSATSRGLIVDNQPVTDSSIKDRQLQGAPPLPKQQNSADPNQTKETASNRTEALPKTLAQDPAVAKEEQEEESSAPVPISEAEIPLTTQKEDEPQKTLENQVQPDQTDKNQNARPTKDERQSKKQPVVEPLNHSGKDELEPPPPSSMPQKHPGEVIPAAHPKRNLIHLYLLRKIFRWLLILAVMAAAGSIVLDYFNFVDIDYQLIYTQVRDFF